MTEQREWRIVSVTALPAGWHAIWKDGSSHAPIPAIVLEENAAGEQRLSFAAAEGTHLVLVGADRDEPLYWGVAAPGESLARAVEGQRRLYRELRP